jgi:hypothetical protein
MTTNAALLTQYKARKQLKAEHKALTAEIRKKSLKLEALRDQLESISRITHVLKGVCLDVSRDDDGHWTDARTVADREKGPLKVHLYQKVNTDYWAVRVNEGYGFQTRFHGGHVIGLRQSWTYAQALARAKRWLLGDETALDER